MKRIFIFIFFLLITTYPLKSQFQKTFGGTNHEVANSIVQTTDGGFIVAGNTFSFSNGYEDIYLVRLNSSGNILWTKNIGGAGNDMAFSIIQTTDRGFAVTGYTNSYGAVNDDIYIVKLDSIGAIQWSKKFSLWNNEYALSIIQTTDGSYVIAGTASTGGVFSSEILIFRINSTGALLWCKSIGGSGDEVARSLIQTSDRGIVLAGYSNSFGSTGNDFYIAKIDSSGAFQWNRTFGGVVWSSKVVNSLIQTTDSGYLLAGESQSFGAGNHDMYFVKLNSSGNLVWTRTVGGTSEDRAYSVVQTPDGGYLSAGLTTSFGVNDFYAVKLDGNGNLIWGKTYGSSGIESAYSLTKSGSGNYVIAGQSNYFGAGANDIYIIKIDSIGNTCANSFNPPNQTGTGGVIGSPTPVVSTQLPVITTVASLSGSGGIMNTICITNVEPVSEIIPELYVLYQNYPNPFNPVTKIKFDIPKEDHVKIILYDITGKEIYIILERILSPAKYEVEFSGNDLASGVYFYNLISGSHSESKKMLIMK